MDMNIILAIAPWVFVTLSICIATANLNSDGNAIIFVVAIVGAALGYFLAVNYFGYVYLMTSVGLFLGTLVGSSMKK